MLSTDLMKRYGNDSGYSIRNLKYMRQFAVEYTDSPFVQVPLAQITWYHHISMFPKVKGGTTHTALDDRWPLSSESQSHADGNAHLSYRLRPVAVYLAGCRCLASLLCYHVHFSTTCQS